MWEGWIPSASAFATPCVNHVTCWRTSLAMSSHVANLLPRSTSLNLRMWSKLQGEVSGEYGGCSNYFHPQRANRSSCRTHSALFGLALLYRIIALSTRFECLSRTPPRTYRTRKSLLYCAMTVLPWGLKWTNNDTPNVIRHHQSPSIWWGRIMTEFLALWRSSMFPLRGLTFQFWFECPGPKFIDGDYSWKELPACKVLGVHCIAHPSLNIRQCMRCPSRCDFALVKLITQYPVEGAFLDATCPL